MKLKKKKIIIIGVVVVVVAAGLIFWFMRGNESSSDPESVVYVDSVADICGLGSGNGLIDRFSGVVEPQKTWDITVASDRTVDEILVKEGDEVKTGDQLFTYNTQEMEENLAQAEIDLDRLANEIDQTSQQIAELKKEKASASADSQLSYTTQINTAENDIKRKEYEQKSKRVEIEKLKSNIANATVISEMDGVVKAINSEDSESMSMSGETQAFMTILAVGDFRIKGTVNEQNMSSIMEGEPVIVHSRVNDSTWTGTLTSVDLENPENSNNNGMYYVSSSDGSSTDTSSNYPFYVEMDSTEGLMLGQHVYIELDNGQEETKEGIWLDSYYIVQEEEEAYVWAASSRDKIERREVTLGEFDEELQKYQIIDGLTEEDYIAFPDDTVKAGDKAEKNVDMMSGMGDMGGMEGLDGGEIPSFDEGGEEFDEGSYEDEEFDEGFHEGEEFEGSDGLEEMPMESEMGMEEE